MILLCFPNHLLHRQSVYTSWGLLPTRGATKQTAQPETALYAWNTPGSRCPITQFIHLSQQAARVSAFPGSDHHPMTGLTRESLSSLLQFQQAPMDHAPGH
jgi:hypothetical protein